MRSDHPIRFHGVALRVRDAEASAAFYHGVFGLEARPSTASASSVRTCSAPARVAGAGVTIVLIQGFPTGTQPIGMDHLSLWVDRAEDVLQRYRRALAAGADATPPRWYGGRYQTYIFDPNGYKIEVLSEGGPESGPDRDDVDTKNPESARVVDGRSRLSRPGVCPLCRSPPRNPSRPTNSQEE
ncbi:MAG: VOC family protein [Phycisphaerae bacterium]|nr:VOC family protein [Phycisphaerae bacterium]